MTTCPRPHHVPPVPHPVACLLPCRVPPLAPLRATAAGVTGGTWPIVDGNDDMSPAPSHATCTAPCCLPPALSCAATATPTCHCCRRHPLVSPHNTHPHPLTHLNHPHPSHTPNHPPAHPLHSPTRQVSILSSRLPPILSPCHLLPRQRPHGHADADPRGCTSHPQPTSPTRTPSPSPEHPDGATTFRPITVVGIGLCAPGGTNGLPTLWDTLMQHKSHDTCLMMDLHFLCQFEPDDFAAMFTVTPNVCMSPHDPPWERPR